MLLKQLTERMPEGSTVHVEIRKKDGKLIYGVTYHHSATSESGIGIDTAILKAMFGNNEPANSVNVTPADKPPLVIDEKAVKTGEPKKQKVDTTRASKVALQKEIREFIAQGAQLFTEKKYDEALVLFDRAHILDPNNKYVQADIDKCKKWIKAMADLNTTPVDNTPKSAPVQETAPVFEAPAPVDPSLDFEIPVMDI